MKRLLFEMMNGIESKTAMTSYITFARTLGGLTRIIHHLNCADKIIHDKKAGKEVCKDKSSNIAPGLAVGASFVIPILIIMTLLGYL